MIKHHLRADAFIDLTSDEAFAWSVAVPFDAARYGARTVLSMVKQANRRGRVRYFQKWEDGEEDRWTKSQFGIIQGEDDLLTFVRDMLEGAPPSAKRYRPYPEAHAYVAGVLVISFDNKGDAQTFTRDLRDLALSPAAAEEHRFTAAKRQAFAAQHTPSEYPDRYSISHDDYWGHVWGTRWVAMVAASGQSAAGINSWMRRNINQRYWAGVWTPGDKPQMIKRSGRYYRLLVEQWQTLIDVTRNRKCTVIVRFDTIEDAQKFDNHFGPSQFL